MIKNYYINGIQQIGIGNQDVYKTYNWYKDHLGMDVQVFDEAAEASLMLPYTGGKPRKRHAILALNLNGGGGVEIWQYTSRKAENANFEIQPGDLGIYITQYKTHNIQTAFQELSQKVDVSPIFTNNANQKHFYLKDDDGNWIDVIEYDQWFSKKKGTFGGVLGAVIGVSSVEKSLDFYRDILGYEVVLDESKGVFDDLSYLLSNAENNITFRRVILTHPDQKRGAFSELLGKTQIELIQRENYQPRKIFENRLWGDMGYIHLCFDVNEMIGLREYCQMKGFPFQVDSGDFDMGDAGGHFAYIEDPDGALIEFVETQKVPIMKSLNWYLNLKNRKKRKPLPRWMINAMGW